MTYINNENLGGYSIGSMLFGWMLDNFPEGSKILELGSGTGTIELCRFYDVMSIENDIDYMNIANSRYVYAPIVNYGNYKWYELGPIIRHTKDFDYDLILVDGPSGAIGREGILHNLHAFNTDVTIVIDDTHREQEKQLANDLAKLLNRDMIEILDNSKSSKEDVVCSSIALTKKG